ncbi:ComEA family DNA-binding protein [Flagellimonas pelagia]|uniref:Helix-hairpin-helix domain-containing protein n=1 Tax=Flagellimonas pelagia TaxID=2306998 RepID=A0A3A1NP06_9FLAO|nr:helix-hairpin-helix domain-containing protein [Allomuricauda maritima]RIV47117.1 helix-hairpin-helix domain-containing protein [Allomuricauda maritima]TXK00815.1 helix-hairpin-helix domain-containing protein [Allomuricauda maritima]
MINNKSHFKFNKQERSGIFFLFLVIVGLQVAFYFVKAKPVRGESQFSLDEVAQAKLDSLKSTAHEDSYVIYPFNPNYISDEKGYTLGLSTEELDRLFAFRKKGQFVNSVEAFQEVTQISDSLLKAIAPYFKFPQWKEWETSSTKKNESNNAPKEIFTIKDLNVASAEDLKKINGIGETLSARIVKFRDKLGGFLVNEQLYDVYGLAPEVVDNVLGQYKVLQPPTIQKIPINTATVNQLAQLVYIDYSLAKQIVQYREENGDFASLDELTNVTSFPKERIDRIKLYLAL